MTQDARLLQVLEPLLKDSRIQCLNKVLSTFQNAHAYIVGGAIRDVLLNLSSPRENAGEDVDVCILNAPAKAVALAVHEALPESRFVPLDETWNIYRVVLLTGKKDETPLFLDIAQAQDNDIHADLTRRDMSFNALALDTQTGVLLDPFNGVNDLKQKRIRALSLANLKDDPLRLLRLFRFHATLQSSERPSSLDAQSLRWAKETLPFLHQVAKERVSCEWFKLLSAPRAFPTVQLMAEAGILEALFPPLTALKCVSPNSHHHLPLWEHTLELVNQAELIYPDLDADTQNALQVPSGHGGTEYGLVKMACLFHDIAKPHCWKVASLADGTLKHRFLGHEKAGAELIKPLLHAWHLSQHTQKRIRLLVERHLYPCTFHAESTEKSVLRYFRKIGDATPYLGVLGLADTLSTRGNAFGEGDLQRSIDNQLALLKRYWETASQRNAPPLLNGLDIMALLHLPPSPEIGRVLEQLKEAQALGEIKTREEAVAWLQT
jgi:poly(A) polymerase